MSENESEYGYVTENSNIPTTGHLVLYSVTGGRVSYASFAEQAKELELPRNFVPSLRKLFYAFANAKNNLDGLGLPSLEVSDDWDGVVDRKVKVLSLEKNREYVVQIESRGRARGKKHVSAQNMFRLEFTPPENFDVGLWSEDYMANIWKDDEEGEENSTEAAQASVSQIRECISVTPYWDDSEIDAALFARITASLMDEFETVATTIDAKMLRDKIVKVLQSELGGLPFRSGQGAWFIPKYNDDESYLETLENYSRLLASFGNANTLTRPTGSANWLGDDGKPRDWHRSSTNLRIMGYIDNERQMSYLRRDIETNLGREIGEYQHKLMEVANNFNDEKIEQFEERLNAISGLRSGLASRLANLTAMVGEVNLNTDMFSDVQEGLAAGTSRIRSVRSSVADRVLALSRFE
jgi:hypothetical protein